MCVHTSRLGRVNRKLYHGILIIYSVLYKKRRKKHRIVKIDSQYINWNGNTNFVVFCHKNVYWRIDNFFFYPFLWISQQSKMLRLLFMNVVISFGFVIVWNSEPHWPKSVSYHTTIHEIWNEVTKLKIGW